MSKSKETRPFSAMLLLTVLFTLIAWPCHADDEDTTVDCKAIDIVELTFPTRSANLASSAR